MVSYFHFKCKVNYVLHTFILNVNKVNDVQTVIFIWFVILSDLGLKGISHV